MMKDWEELGYRMKQHIKNYLFHCYVVLCCIALATHGICAGTFVLWLSAFLMLPIKNLQDMYREKIPKWGIVKAIAVFMLFFVGMAMLPTDTKEEQRVATESTVEPTKEVTEAVKTIEEVEVTEEVKATKKTEKN